MELDGVGVGEVEFGGEFVVDFVFGFGGVFLEVFG